GLSGGHSHNEKILSWHLLEDLLGWTAVLIGAIVIYFFNITWLDPVLAIGIALFVLWNVARNLRGPLRIVLQYVPSEDDLAQLRQSISQLDGFHSIDQLHAWSLDGRQHVLTAHIRVKDKSLALPLKKKATALIEAKGFRYVTLDVEPSDQV
ncbi:MAG: cation transporter, partial [Proteobacteria bacterium]|nr:cation transporter [Pseudomonadota bacterium]